MMRILSILFILASFTSVGQTVQTIGSPGTRVNSRGDFISDSILYLPRTQVTSRTPFQSGAIRYQASDSSIYQWTGTAWRKISGTVDSLLFSTRAWRQKGDDSLAAIINTRTDTLLISTRAWRQKGIDSVASVRIGGSGTTNAVPRFTASRTLGNSTISDDGSRAYIETSGTGGGLEIRRFGTPIGILATPSSTQISLSALGSNDLIYVTNAGTLLRLAAGGGVSIDGTETWIGGTDNGAYKFQVNGNVYNTTGANVFNASSGETLFGTTTDAGDFRVQIAGGLYNTTGAALAVSSGNVGIGTTSPSEKLHIVGRARVTTIDSSASPINMLWADNDGVIRKTAVPTASVSGGTTNFIPLWSSSTALTSSIIEQRSSELLVNTNRDTGAYVLQVQGASWFGGAIKTMTDIDIGGNNVISSSGRTVMNMGTSGTTRWYSSGSGTSIQFYPNNAVQMSIEDGGEVWMGYTTDQGAFRLQVNGAALADGGYRSGAPNGGTAATWKLGIVVAGSYTAASNYLQVDVGGTLYYIGLVTPD